MTILQFVITRSPMGGDVKLSTMGIDRKTGMGVTLETYRGSGCFILWKLWRLMSHLKAAGSRHDV